MERSSEPFVQKFLKDDTADCSDEKEEKNSKQRSEGPAFETER
jgi:hypothetical protein